MQGPTQTQIKAHIYGEAAAWNILLNIAIICVIFKHTKLAIIIHSILGGIIFILTYFFVLWFLIPHGFIQYQKLNAYAYFHAVVGIMLLGFIIFQVGGGLYCLFCQVNGKLDVAKVKLWRISHKFFGYFLALLYKINIIYHFYGFDLQFYFLIGWQSASIILYLYLKLFLPKLQHKILDSQNKNNCQQIHDIQQVRKQYKYHIIFGNYVYDASKLKIQHPGGYKVISAIMGREVDRFLYGMYSAELFPQILSYSHSASALKLVGKPIAKLVSPLIYIGFNNKNQLEKVKLKSMALISSKTQIYLLGLSGVDNSLQFQGYSEVRQLGQYYSLRINSSVTRLYTAVNFLLPKNIDLINRIFSELFYQPRNTLTEKNDLEIELDLMSHRISLFNKDKSNISNYSSNYLPIMLKIYSKGKFTSQIQENTFYKSTLTLSSPKGQGLELHTTTPGQIIIIAGGTGLFPFSDLIDLLHKEQLLQNQHPLSEQIKHQNPILVNKPFLKFKFTLLLAIQQSDDIHPITLKQLIALSQSKRIKVVLRISQNQQTIAKICPQFQFTKQYFNKRILAQASCQNLSKIWICGPPKMNSEIGQTLLSNGYNKSTFLHI